MGNPIIDFPWTGTHVAATALVKTGTGALHTIVVNGLTTAGDATVYDGIDATGTVIAVIHLDTTTSISVQPITLTYDIKVVTGIYVAYDQSLAADFTVTFK